VLDSQKAGARGGTPALPRPALVELGEQFERIRLTVLGQVNVCHTANVREVARSTRDRHVKARALSPEVHHARADDLAPTGDVECACADRPPACAERALSPLGAEIDSGLALDIQRRGERVAELGPCLPTSTNVSRSEQAGSLRGHAYLVNVQFRCLGLWSPQPPGSLVVHL
jgi:hypothetical protein